MIVGLTSMLDIWVTVASAAAVVLAAVLLTAAVSKALAPLATADEFADLDLAYPAVLARLVPALEAAVAIALIVRPDRGGVAALMLLLAFTAVLVRTIRSGREVSCGCLGAMSKAPVT